MTKTLTEQWQDGELQAGEYYVKDSNGVEIDGYYPENSWERGFVNHSKHEVKEVLAPVPSYDKLQTKDMLLDSYKKENKRLKAVAEHCENVAGQWADQLADLSKKVERLHEQLKEANVIIDLYFPKDKKINAVCVKPINDYREKWGVE